jgi:hypothetical protein
MPNNLKAYYLPTQFGRFALLDVAVPLSSAHWLCDVAAYPVMKSTTVFAIRRKRQPPTIRTLGRRA